MSISELSAAKLVELGGLKTLCSAPLRCVAHGLAVPCDACEMEGTIGVVCEACGHHFPQGLLEDRNRACESQAEFARTGKIAFAKEATAALQALELERQREAKEAKEAKERQAVELARLERKRLEEKRVERERANRERTERERRDADIPLPRPVTPGAPVPPAPSGGGMSLAKWMVSAAVGGLIVVVAQHLWHENGGDSKSLQSAPASSGTPGRADAPFAPGIVAPASASQPLATLPAMAGYVTDSASALSADDQVYLNERLRLMPEVGARARIVVVPSTGSETVQQYGQRLGNAWNASGEETRTDLLIVVVKDDQQIRLDIANDLNRTLTNEDAGTLISEHFIPATRSSGIGGGLRRMIQQIEKTLGTSKYALVSGDELRTATLGAVEKMLNGIVTWDGKQSGLSQVQEAVVGSAIARLESMPRPLRGDRKSARQLHDSSMKLIGQSGFESLLVDKLRQANAADPLDVQILNDLAYAEMVAAQPAVAIEHLLQTLRFSPTRTSAWVNLAEAVVKASRSPSEVVNFATSSYLAGYWYSKDRAKTVLYLRDKASAADEPEGIRLAATGALKRLESIEQAHAAGQPSAQLPQSSTPARFDSNEKGWVKADPSDSGATELLVGYSGRS